MNAGSDDPGSPSRPGRFSFAASRVWTLLVAGYLGLAAALFLHRPAWVDEAHFVEAVRFFGATPLFESLRDYPEVTPPLFYLGYAAWGHLFGFGLIPLRLLSLGIAAAALFVLYRFAHRHLAAAALPLCALLLLNPYLPGAAVFVFTDLSALLCVLSALWFYALLTSAASAADRPAGAASYAPAALAALSALFICAALLIRQYTVVFWAALCVAALGERLRARPPERKAWTRALVALAAAPLPLAALALWWGGLAPPSGRALWIVGEGLAWNPSAFTTYAAFLPLYLLPCLFVWRSRFRGLGRLAWAVVPAALFYAAFPVRASETARVQAGVETVGLLHRAIRAVAGPGLPEHLLLAAVFCAGVLFLLIVLRDDLRLWRRGDWSSCTPLSLSLYFFLAVMPFSYQIWEKYLLLVLPVAAVRFARTEPPRHATP